MENFNKEFEEIKNSNNFELIDDFLIKIGKNPSQNSLKYIKYFIENLNSQTKNKITINLIWSLGEIGKLYLIDDFFVTFLINEFFNSDQWIRKEIVDALIKISKQKELNKFKDIFKIISFSLGDYYKPVVLDGFELCILFDNPPNFVNKALLRTLNRNDKEIFKRAQEFFENQYNIDMIFKILDKEATYKILERQGLRRLLSSICRSVVEAENLKEKIEKSNWSSEYKKMFLEEIETLQKILLKNI
ncbi:MAG: hypothetical protein ACTSVV_15035 [Promethearchaeota archaeon]